MRAIVASPISAFRQVLAAVARDGGTQPTAVDPSSDCIGDLTRNQARLLILHHQDAEVAARLAKHALDRGMTVVALADRPEDRPVLLGAGAIAVAATASWTAVADAIRSAVGLATAIAA